MIVPAIILATRTLVFGVFAIAAIMAGTHWAVKHGHLSPFGAWPRLVRQLSTPLLRPVERRLHRGGGNPASAPYTLFWVALFGGLLLIASVEGLIGFVLSLISSASLGAAGLVRFVGSTIISLLMLALLVRVISSWFGISPYSKPMRVVHGLTDWLIEPLRKVIPPFGMIDVTPLAAYFILYLVRGLLFGS